MKWRGIHGIEKLIDPVHKNLNSMWSRALCSPEAVQHFKILSWRGVQHLPLQTRWKCLFHFGRYVAPPGVVPREHKISY
jgi:hypothetical protein